MAKMVSPGTRLFLGDFVDGFRVQGVDVSSLPASSARRGRRATVGRQPVPA